MKTVNKSILAVIITAVCAPAFASTITTGEQAAALQQFAQAADFYNNAPLDSTPANQFDDAYNNAKAGLIRLGVHAGDVDSVLANSGMAHDVSTLSQFVGYELNTVQTSAPMATVKAPSVSAGAYRDSLNAAQAATIQPAKAITVKAPVTLPLNTHPTVAQQDALYHYGVKGAESVLTPQVSGDAVSAPAQMKVLEATPVAVPSKQPVAVPSQVPQATPVAHIQREPVRSEVPVAVPSKVPAIQQRIPTPLAVPPVTQKTPEVSATAYRSQVTTAQAALVKDSPVKLNDTISKVTGQSVEHISGIVNGKVIDQTVTTQTVQFPETLSSVTVDNVITAKSETGNTASAHPVAEKHNAVIPAALITKPATTKAATAPVAKSTSNNMHSQHTTNERHNVVVPATMIADTAQPQPQVIEHYSVQPVQVADRATQHQVASNTQQISKLNNNFSNLKSEVESNKHEAAAGASAAMAQANIPQVLNGQTFAVGAGVGGYDGENAVAVGVSFRASQNVTVKATVSDDTQQNVGYGAGVSVGW
ncbi:YadA C-terminal domain-containing protein [Lelliottia wanjuensis]|uniref:YadA C-terminal domain-containing protein n=1 Tax=Lelliottia wanjuensis TaxID=3050585 RepID=UPI00254BA5C5|nr:YadA-like family protein [Lelliottia sp. V86_10]MDK9585884.1 YadA-like family protein [Lelliottia sp. V86_10]